MKERRQEKSDICAKPEMTDTSSKSAIKLNSEFDHSRENVLIKPINGSVPMLIYYSNSVEERQWKQKIRYQPHEWRVSCWTRFLSHLHTCCCNIYDVTDLWTLCASHTKHSSTCEIEQLKYAEYTLNRFKCSNCSICVHFTDQIVFNSSKWQQQHANLQARNKCYMWTPRALITQNAPSLEKPLWNCGEDGKRLSLQINRQHCKAWSISRLYRVFQVNFFCSFVKHWETSTMLTWLECFALSPSRVFHLMFFRLFISVIW